MLPNHHITKPVFIGEIKGDGQFDVVWKTPGLVPGAAWSPYLEGSKDLDRRLGQPQVRQLQQGHQEVRRRVSACRPDRHDQIDRGGGGRPPPPNNNTLPGSDCDALLCRSPRRVAVRACACCSRHRRAAPRRFEEALPRFTADDYGETEAGIGEVAASGNPLARASARRAAGRPPALQRRQEAGLHQGSRPTACSTPRPASRSPATPPADLDTVRVNNRLRRAIDAALGALTLLAPDPGKRFDAAQAVFKSQDASALPALEKAIAKETNARVKKAMLEARAAIVLWLRRRSEADKVAAIAVIRERGDQDALALLGEPAGRHCRRRSQRAARDARRIDPERPRAVEHGAERLVRPLARLGAAARRHRPRHHVRRHGRHQHGAWRDGDARRLRDLRGAGGDPRPATRRCSTTRW